MHVQDRVIVLRNSLAGPGILHLFAILQAESVAVTFARRKCGGQYREFIDAGKQCFWTSGTDTFNEMMQEADVQMPILDDILHHKVLGREYKRGILEGEFTGPASTPSWNGWPAACICKIPPYPE